MVVSFGRCVSNRTETIMPMGNGPLDRKQSLPSLAHVFSLHQGELINKGKG